MIGEPAGCWLVSNSNVSAAGTKIRWRDIEGSTAATAAPDEQQYRNQEEMPHRDRDQQVFQPGFSLFSQEVLSKKWPFEKGRVQVRKSSN